MPSRQCCNATICCADKHRNKTAKLQILFFFFFLKFKNFFFSWILMLRLIYTNKSVSCVCVRMRNVGGKKRRKGLAEREIGNHREHRSGTHTHTHTHTPVLLLMVQNAELMKLASIVTQNNNVVYCTVGEIPNALHDSWVNEVTKVKPKKNNSKKQEKPRFEQTS